MASHRFGNPVWLLVCERRTDVLERGGPGVEHIELRIALAVVGLAEELGILLDFFRLGFVWDRTIVSTMRLPKHWRAKWLAQTDTSSGTKLSQAL